MTASIFSVKLVNTPKDIIITSKEEVVMSFTLDKECRGGNDFISDD